MKNRGFTLVELLVVIAIIALLVGLLLPALAKAQQSAKETKDATQIKQIHQAMLSWASKDKAGRLPIPGYINRCGNFANQGTEDPSLNTTQNLYSSMIAADYFKPDLLIGPTEVNPAVIEMGKNGTTPYNFASYNPVSDSYWDTNFAANISATPGNGGSNVSYAHLALFGLRKDTSWRNTQDSSKPLMGTRGPKVNLDTGVVAPDDFNKSYTLLLIGPKNDWWGNLCYGDNHMDLAKSFTPEGVTFECGNLGNTKDNIFAPGPFSAQANCKKKGCIATCAAGANPTQVLNHSAGDTWLGFFPNTMTGCLLGAPAYDPLLP